MGITINTEPIELVIDGTTIAMQCDPTATSHWDALLEIEVTFSDPKKRDTARKAMTDALTSMAHTPDDAEQLVKLDLGVVILQKVAVGYIEAVTGFPTQQPSPSPKR